MSQTTHIYAFSTALTSIHKCMWLNSDRRIRQVLLLIKISSICVTISPWKSAIFSIRDPGPWAPSFDINPCGSASLSKAEVFEKRSSLVSEGVFWISFLMFLHHQNLWKGNESCLDFCKKLGIMQTISWYIMRRKACFHK